MASSVDMQIIHTSPLDETEVELLARIKLHNVVARNVLCYRDHFHSLIQDPAEPPLSFKTRLALKADNCAFSMTIATRQDPNQAAQGMPVTAEMMQPTDLKSITQSK